MNWFNKFINRKQIVEINELFYEFKISPSERAKRIRNITNPKEN